MSSNPCIDAWKWISCDKSMQFVKKIVLDQLNFTGVLDAAFVCLVKNLAVLSLNNNNVSGILPDNISNYNGFSGGIPDISRVLGVLTFLAQHNQFDGVIPKFEFSNLEEFNGHFNASSFLGNPELCGKPLPNNCPPQPPVEKKGSSSKMYLMYLGYALIALVLVSLIALKVIQRKKHKDKKEIAKRGL
ncbi:Hypothetical predicted protein [Olea europaea subsp. europaea]|uniref:Uncharacterized protein n=1 Tax=Olea europaea subsp. europaea TaxID=158383 RepID=A0A8S0R045_OLEEU|nr:Hypothetical predicted protein [Olea europaea subsp. europaea]